MTDEITLTLPRHQPFYRIAHLVVGGLAVRLDLTFENLEDIQLALQGVLDRPDADGDVTVSLRVQGETLQAVIGPFELEQLRADLEHEEEDEISLRRLLDTVVDSVELGERDGGHWVELTKTVKTVSA